MQSDGRRKRSDATRLKVGEALADLVAETGSLPDIDTIARRAQVGRTSVFRYFDGVQALEIELARYLRSVLVERFPWPKPVGVVGQRLADLVAHRSAFYEHLTPFRLFIDAARTRGNSELDEFIECWRFLVRDNLALMLAPEVANNNCRLDELELISSWGAWRTMRAEQSASIDQACERLQRVLLAVLQSQA